MRRILLALECVSGSHDVVGRVAAWRRLLLASLVISMFIACVLDSACVLAQKSGSGRVTEATIQELVEKLDSATLEGKRDIVYEIVRRQDVSKSAIAALVSVVGDDDEQIQFQALMGLARAGENAEPAVAALIELLGERSDQVRYRAAVALGEIGESSVAPLCDAWEQANFQVRLGMARAFERIGNKAVRAVPLLKQALDSEDQELSWQAAVSMVAIDGDREETRLALAEHSSEVVRRVGIKALATISVPNRRVGERLREATQDARAKVRETAVIAVASSELSASQKVGCLVKTIVDEDRSVRAATLAALRKASLVDEPLGFELGEMLVESNDSEIANTLVEALAMLQEPAANTMEALIAADLKADAEPDLIAKTIARFGEESVQDFLERLPKHPALKDTVAKCLVISGASAGKVVLAGLSHPEPIVRDCCATALGFIRPFEKQALLSLLKLAADESKLVREAALRGLVEALSEASSDANVSKQRESIEKVVESGLADASDAVRAVAFRAIPNCQNADELLKQSLAGALNDESSRVRVAALDVLSVNSIWVDEYSSNVIELASDDDALVRRGVLEAISQLTLEDEKSELSSIVVNGLRDDDAGVRQSATSAVAALGLYESNVVEALQENLESSTEVIVSTLGTLEEAGEKAEGLYGPVTGLLENANADVRVRAIATLASIQGDKSILTDLLIRSLDDMDWAVRNATAVALGEIGPQAKMAIPKLFTMIDNESDSSMARGAIREIDAVPVEALPLLIDGLHSESFRTQFYAMFMIRKLGPDAAEALPTLEEMLKNTQDGRRAESRRRGLRETIEAIKADDDSDA